MVRKDADIICCPSAGTYGRAELPSGRGVGCHAAGLAKGVIFLRREDVVGVGAADVGFGLDDAVGEAVAAVGGEDEGCCERDGCCG